MVVHQEASIFSPERYKPQSRATCRQRPRSCGEVLTIISHIRKGEMARGDLDTPPGTSWQKHKIQTDFLTPFCLYTLNLGNPGHLFGPGGSLCTDLTIKEQFLSAFPSPTVDSGDVPRASFLLGRQELKRCHSKGRG